MDDILVDKLNLVRRELSASKAMSLLLEYLPIAKKQFEEKPTEHTIHVLASYEREIIFLTIDQANRVKKWKELLDYLAKWKSKESNKDFELEYGFVFIDYLEDELAFNITGFIDNRAIDNLLIKNISAASNLFQTTKDYRFLVLKGTYLRFKARYFCKLFTDKVSRIEESLRCIEKAEKLNNKDASVFIQKGLILFFKSAINSRTHETFTSSVKLAEESFLTAVTLSNAPLAYLSLCFFYRFTFQPDVCCNLFVKYVRIESNKRRLYRNAYLFGEAVYGLWFRQRPKEIIDYFLQEANIILTDSINSGYEFPRILISKAAVSAALGKIDYASNYIFKLFAKSNEFSWNGLVEISDTVMADYEKRNYIDNAALNGITDSSVWNSIGTFSKAFLQDNYLSGNCYRIALALSPNNAVVLTNLARLLFEENASDHLEEIRWLLEQAEEKADSRFYWWRILKKNFEDIYGGPEQSKNKYFIKQKSRTDEFDDLVKTYEALKKEKDEILRGKQLESLVTNILRRSNINSIDSYRNALGKTTYQEIDGAFVFDHKYYMIEAKWRKDKSDADHVSQLERRLVNALPENYGLLISMAGFTQPAIDTAKLYLSQRIKIILMDGEELEDAMMNRCIIDILLAKQQELHLHKNPYFKYSVSNKNTD